MWPAPKYYHYHHLYYYKTIHRPEQRDLITIVSSRWSGKKERPDIIFIKDKAHKSYNNKGKFLCFELNIICFLIQFIILVLTGGLRVETELQR